MSYQIPKQVRDFMSKFTDADWKIYIVGGAVRDLLMKKKVSDWDFTTDAKPEEILKIFPQGFYDNKFGTVGVAMKDSDNAEPTSDKTTTYEVTTMRKEGVYKDHRHPTEVLWTNNIETDLGRRDFTINAMALSPTLELIDIFSGQQDLSKSLIRAVGDPNIRFQEDAIRIVKAFRLVAQLNFEIEEQTYKALKKHSNLITDIAWERIREEFFKLLISDNAFEGITLMHKAGILQIILPEIEACFGIIQKGPKHARVYDVGEHSLLTLKNCPSKNYITKLAALVHDIGKVETVKTDQSGNVTFYQHDIVGGKIALKIAKRFNLSKEQTDKFYRLVRWHLFTVDEHQTDSAIRRFIKNVGLDNINEMMALREGDRLGGGTQTPTSWRLEKFKDRIKQVLDKPFSVQDLKVDGNDIMQVLNIPPSKKVGEILNKLFQEVLKDSAKNDRDYLLSKIKSVV